ncbi:hypothetical protein ARMGADRAFT_1036335 [Armillaria gallica]|uniref:Uncharacterized protein n=1 Tax=Armillaria gallica TaxID=47427 RepID=A0A2H3CVW1_ARMGA|nr:hypothetical protein ARMGADRAFT_1036335 [Armillaria gallica]
METVLKQSCNLRLVNRQKSHGSWSQYHRGSFSIYHSFGVGVVTVQRENIIYSVEERNPLASIEIVVRERYLDDKTPFDHSSTSPREELALEDEELPCPFVQYTTAFSLLLVETKFRWNMSLAYWGSHTNNRVKSRSIFTCQAIRSIVNKLPCHLDIAHSTWACTCSATGIGTYKNPIFHVYTAQSGETRTTAFTVYEGGRGLCRRTEEGVGGPISSRTSSIAGVVRNVMMGTTKGDVRRSRVMAIADSLRAPVYKWHPGFFNSNASLAIRLGIYVLYLQIVAEPFNFPWHILSI